MREEVERMMEDDGKLWGGELKTEKSKGERSCGECKEQENFMLHLNFWI